MASMSSASQKHNITAELKGLHEHGSPAGHTLEGAAMLALFVVLPTVKHEAVTTAQPFIAASWT